MSAHPVFESIPSLDAVTRLFELVARGEADSAEAAQIEALVYDRLMRAYEGDDVPSLTHLMAA